MNSADVKRSITEAGGLSALPYSRLQDLYEEVIAARQALERQVEFQPSGNGAAEMKALNDLLVEIDKALG